MGFRKRLYQYLDNRALLGPLGTNPTQGSSGSASRTPETWRPESELSCQICSEIFHQPLLLCPCYHTFCGHCIKRWFGQNTTCPTCRTNAEAAVPNRQVASMAEAYLDAHPLQKKTAAELREIGRLYTAGEQLLPSLPPGHLSGPSPTVLSVPRPAVDARSRSTSRTTQEERSTQASPGQHGEDSTTEDMFERHMADAMERSAIEEALRRSLASTALEPPPSRRTVEAIHDRHPGDYHEERGRQTESRRERVQEERLANIRRREQERQREEENRRVEYRRMLKEAQEEREKFYRMEEARMQRKRRREDDRRRLSPTVLFIHGQET
ncbi:hypothetical protein W97_07578 [Coniosporium apollinis CBS 100218]|uniref:RING-type domain-containing protein n=1 Tax=Coniosporium apollinis (strain CBS 100218) TaxID=1168221 RepID=R7Z296_CONA1|nr:uncharacterized protein W97_07578 [Coniosporium apollinis CBS 100218]EON68320.1 hypothetical protein W97_07578 [Coniosporium apollinis CBS 100218]